MCSSHLSLSAMALNTNTCGGTADWPSRSPSMVAWSYNERDFREAQAWDPYTAFNGFLCQGSKSGAGADAAAGRAERDAPAGHWERVRSGHRRIGAQRRKRVCTGARAACLGCAFVQKKSCVFRDAGAPLSLSLRLGVY